MSQRISHPSLRAAAAVLSLVIPLAVRAQIPPASAPADRLLSAVDDPHLAALVGEVLERNPDIQTLRQKALAAEERAPQARSWPDPMVGATLFLLPPETRVGPQQVMVALSQRLPWFGKLELREQAALAQAAAAWAQVEARRLELLTEARRLYHELGFLEAQARIVADDRATLSRYEELARTRYASGMGLQQAVIKIQAEMTRDENRLLDIGTRRATMVAAIDGLRNRPGEPIVEVALPAGRRVDVSAQEARAGALEARPEIAQVDADIRAAATQIDLARKEYRPDVTLGLTYTAVGPRQDAAAGVMAPEDDGHDVLGITASISLPFHRKRLAASVAEASAREGAARQMRRMVETGIDRALGELIDRVDLTWRQLRLLEDVLSVQAEESLASAEAAYAAGNLGALDLLDAERMLLDVRTSVARTRADYAIALARLEGAIGAPLGSAAEGDGR